MGRAVLFIMTNLAVIAIMSVILSLFGANRFLNEQGLNLGSLLIFSIIIGFTGSFFSLLISKPMAKWTTGAKVIQQPENSFEHWLLKTVKILSQRANIKTPEIAVYNGQPNAFATGAFKDDALVAVSTGLIQNMSKEEIEGVLGHEIAHIANGDMITMTLLQGVLNTFVVFLSRLVGYIVDRFLSRGGSSSSGVGYFVSVITCQIIFGLVASIIIAWFSRYREFRADFGSTQLLGSKKPMVNALTKLAQMQSSELPESVATLGINKPSGILQLFSTHPPIEQRIMALQNN